jgi:hypothetical protein
MTFAAAIKISANFDGSLDRTKRLARSFIFHSIVRITSKSWFRSNFKIKDEIGKWSKGK